MRKTPSIFISYSRKDHALATALERALTHRGLTVWRDARSIPAGIRWFASIEDGVRGSRGLVVLITPRSAESEWVAFEYAFARGARIPVVAVTVGRACVPGPVQSYQVVHYSANAKHVAQRVDHGLLAQARSAARANAFAPTLVARFQEVDGEVERIGGGKTPSLCVDLWIANAPRRTQRVAFEIMDLGFRDHQWSVKRKQAKADGIREFLTDDVNSWGDVEIWARGMGRGAGNWTIRSTLYQALAAHYRDSPVSKEVRAALRQIRNN